jgi:flagellar biosynthesis/type III secretory pathway M-ring protein FliF/YscJ
MTLPPSFEDTVTVHSMNVGKSKIEIQEGNVTATLSKNSKKIAYIVIALGAVILVALLAFQFVSRSVLMQLTNGRLEGADYWRAEPVILSGAWVLITSSACLN